MGRKITTVDGKYIKTVAGQDLETIQGGTSAQKTLIHTLRRKGRKGAKRRRKTRA